MGITSERLGELTKRKLELIREIDKDPENTALHDKLKRIEENLITERDVVLNVKPSEKEESSEKATVPTKHKSKVGIKEMDLRVFL